MTETELDSIRSAWADVRFVARVLAAAAADVAAAVWGRRPW